MAAENIKQLQSNVQVAAAFKPLTISERQRIENLTATVWEDNTFFRRWT
jgi:hypothetical protein